MSKNEIKLENYEGPLDLLIDLIHQQKMDIFEIDLMELATEYLKIIDSISDKEINLAGEYLVMSASLMQLKAKSLLQTPESIKEIEEEKSDLLQKLSEYQKYKNLVGLFKIKENMRQDHFSKSASSYEGFQYDVDESKLDGHMSSVRMISALRKMFERLHGEKLRQTIIEKFDYSPEDRRRELLVIMKDKKTLTFEEVFNVPTMNHFVVTVLTILDMSKNQELIIHQESQFGDIKFERGEAYGK